MSEQRFVVIGLGRFGAHLARTLAQRGAEVVVIDNSPERTEEFKDEISAIYTTDASKEENLKRIDLSPEEDIAIVSIGENDIESSILVTALLKQHFGFKKVIARAVNHLHEKILKLVGADETVNPERDLAERLAQNLLYPGLLEALSISDNYSIGEVVAPKSFSGKTLAQLNIRKNYGVTVVAIKRKFSKYYEGGKSKKEEDVQHNPPPNAYINEGDVLVCIGTYQDLEKLSQIS